MVDGAVLQGAVDEGGEAPSIGIPALEGSPGNEEELGEGIFVPAEPGATGDCEDKALDVVDIT